MRMLRTRIGPGVSLVLLVLASVTTLAFGRAPSVAATDHVAATSTPDFSVTVSPLSQTRKRGTGAPYFVTINCRNGFNGAVTLSLTGDIPPNVVVSISNPTGCGSLSDGEVDLQIEKHSTTTGTFAMTIHAVSGSLEHDVGISLTIV
jgi:hypothetical protein